MSMRIARIATSLSQPERIHAIYDYVLNFATSILCANVPFIYCWSFRMPSLSPFTESLSRRTMDRLTEKWLVSAHIAWRIEGINRIIVINIVKSKLITVQWQKGLEHRAGRSVRGRIISHFPHQYFPLMCNERAKRECLHVSEGKKKEKWLAKRKFILICFRRMTTTAATTTTMMTTTTKKYGALEYKKRRMCCHSQSNDTTIFMYYAENLHSLRLGFKTFYKWKRDGGKERERESVRRPEEKKSPVNCTKRGK